MKLIASLLASAVLSAASTVAAHATTINPGVDLNLVSGTTNYSFLQTTPGTFVATDGLNSVTAVYLHTALSDTFAVTEVCLTAGLTPCKGYTFTIADTNAAAVSVGLGLSAAAMADTTLTTNLATLRVDGSLGAATETVSFALPAGSVSPSAVPEPGTLSLLATGLIGAAGAVRRRFRA